MPRWWSRSSALWGVTPMDHFGATEYAIPIGNFNAISMPVKAGSMGRPFPGFRMAIVDEGRQRATRRGGRFHRQEVRSGLPLLEELLGRPGCQQRSGARRLDRDGRSRPP